MASIRRYNEQSGKVPDWILRFRADISRKHDLPHRDGSMATYYQTHYRDGWTLAKNAVRNENS